MMVENRKNEGGKKKDRTLIRVKEKKEGNPERSGGETIL